MALASAEVMYSSGQAINDVKTLGDGSMGMMIHLGVDLKLVSWLGVGVGVGEGAHKWGCRMAAGLQKCP